MEDGKEYLTEMELLELNLFSEKIKSTDKDQDIANLKLQLIEAQRSIITYKAMEDKKTQDNLKKSQLERLKGISDNHGIVDDRWSYNPTSGEIIITDENI